MKQEISYKINKGINRPIEFRGLKAQYIYILAGGLLILLMGFVIGYIAGVPVYLCLPVVLLSGLGLFVGVYRLSHRYGEHGLMKALAYRKAPTAIICRSRKEIVKRLVNKKNEEQKDDRHNDTGRIGTGRGFVAEQRAAFRDK